MKNAGARMPHTPATTEKTCSQRGSTLPLASTMAATPMKNAGAHTASRLPISVIV